MQNFGNFLALGAVFGFVASSWRQVKELVWKLLSLWIQRIEILDENQWVISYLVKNYKYSKAYDKFFASYLEQKKDGGFVEVFFEQLGRKSLVFWNGYFPFITYLDQPNSDNVKARDSRSNDITYEEDSTNFSKKRVILCIRGTLNIDDILKNVAITSDKSWDDEGKLAENRFRIKMIPDRTGLDLFRTGGNHIYSYIPWYKLEHNKLLNIDRDHLGPKCSRNGNAIDCLVFPDKVKKLINEIKLWKASKDWYESKGIPWKRGWLLHGPPGTGKTALARAFAEDLDIPLLVFNLAELNNTEFRKEWNYVKGFVPCIVLIEDIDNVFNKRENIVRADYAELFSKLSKTNSGSLRERRQAQEEGSGVALNFDTLLNCLDGPDKLEGVFTIFTTNDISKVDEALGTPREIHDVNSEFISTRPGRVDKVIELTYMQLADKVILANKLLHEYPNELQGILRGIEMNPTLPETPAQFVEKCSQIALKCFTEANGVES